MSFPLRWMVLVAVVVGVAVVVAGVSSVSVIPWLLLAAARVLRWLN